MASASVAELASYIIEQLDEFRGSPTALGIKICGAWPDATPEEIDRALELAALIEEARSAPERTELQALIEHVRRTFGALTLAGILLRMDVRLPRESPLAA